MATIYLSYPEGEDLDASRRRVQQLLRDVEKSGNVGLAPIVLLRDVIDWQNVNRRLEASFDIMKGCDYVWIMGENVSVITRREIEFAAKCGIEVRFFDNLHWELTKGKDWTEAERRLDLIRNQKVR